MLLDVVGWTCCLRCWLLLVGLFYAVVANIKVQHVTLHNDIRATRRQPEYNKMIGYLQAKIKAGNWDAPGGLERGVLDKRIGETAKHRRRMLEKKAKAKGEMVNYYAGPSGGNFFLLFVPIRFCLCVSFIYMFLQTTEAKKALYKDASTCGRPKSDCIIYCLWFLVFSLGFSFSLLVSLLVSPLVSPLVSLLVFTLVSPLVSVGFCWFLLVSVDFCCLDSPQRKPNAREKQQQQKKQKNIQSHLVPKKENG